MYGKHGSSDHSDSEDEGETSPPMKSEKTVHEVKTYSVLPPPTDYTPAEPLEDTNAEDGPSDSSSSSDSDKPVRKRKRKNRRHTDEFKEEKSHQNDTSDKKLTKNQKRKLKKKRRKEKQKNEDKSVTFSFLPSEDNQISAETTSYKEIEDKVVDLSNFFDAVWDVYKLQERQKSVEQQEVFDELNKSLSVLDVRNKEMESQLNIIHNIKRLILLGDVKSAGDLMSSMKSDGCYISEDDTCLYCVVHDERSAAESLGQDLESLDQWAGEWGVTFNADKTKSMYFTRKSEDCKQIKDVTIDNGTMLFIWDGHLVNGTTVPSGQEYEPILLNISYGNDQLFIRGFSKSLTLEEFKVIVSEETRIKTKDLRLKRIVNQDTNPKLIDFSSDLLDTTLETLRLKNGDEIIAENKSKLPVSDRTIQNKMKMTYPIYIENRGSSILHDDNKRIRLEVTADMTVSEVKCMAVSKFCMSDIIDGGRLRHDHETLGLRSPIYENMTLTEANITKGSNLVLESGPAPSTNQMTLTFTPGDLRSDLSDLEVTVDKMTTVGDCLQCMILKAGFTDDDWHLQKTNWCGEPAEVLDDLDLTLEMSLVNHGDHLLLVKGKLPPKGFVRIPIWLYPSPRKPFCDSASNTGNGMFSWLTNQIQGLFRSDNKPQDTSITSEEPVYLGDIEVALVITLEEFKFQILTLPSLSELSLPTQGFLRVTMVESGYLSTVLKGTSQTLQKLKVKSCNRVAVQILDEEENLNVNQIVLNIKQRIPNTKEYLPPVEIIWDTSQGPSINSLEKTIADRLFIPQDHLGMAKHFSKRFDWLIIREGPNKSGGKGKKKAQKTNLRHGPYNLQDGDVIGIKNLQLEYERKEDYCTIEDDQGKIELQKQAEEKKKQ
ncbi:ubiquitin carboxyl-terminal hydrolase 40 [Mytilus galloprovincialis]|nr:ubiquitin carboxyl-terminal hydrolase 40 [Mytilus galloprovincialis]